MVKEMDYRDKVVLVTGGAKGIGKAIGNEYLVLGATVIIADIDATGSEAAVQEWRQKGFKADAHTIDLQDTVAIEKMFETLVAKYRKIDILINNAGKGIFKPMHELTTDEWNEIINLNLRATFVASREFARYNRNFGYGRIINIASTRAIMSEAKSEAYAASKGGIVSLTHALALSLSEANVTVNSISPGWIVNCNYEQLAPAEHHQHPSRRVGRPEDIARMCVFLTDEKNDFITGQNMVVDGGMTKKMIYIE